MSGYLERSAQTSSLSQKLAAVASNVTPGLGHNHPPKTQFTAGLPDGWEYLVRPRPPIPGTPR